MKCGHTQTKTWSRSGTTLDPSGTTEPPRFPGALITRPKGNDLSVLSSMWSESPAIKYTGSSCKKRAASVESPACGHIGGILAPVYSPGLRTCDRFEVTIQYPLRTAIAAAGCSLRRPDHWHFQCPWFHFSPEQCDGSGGWRAALS